MEFVDAYGPTGEERKKQLRAFLWSVGLSFVLFFFTRGIIVPLLIYIGYPDGDTLLNLWKPRVMALAHVINILMVLIIMRHYLGPLKEAILSRIGKPKIVAWWLLVLGGILFAYRAFLLLSFDTFKGPLEDIGPLEMINSLSGFVVYFLVFFIVLQNLILEKSLIFQIGLFSSLTLFNYSMAISGILINHFYFLHESSSISERLDLPEHFFVRYGCLVFFYLAKDAWCIYVYKRYRSLWPVFAFLLLSTIVYWVCCWVG